MPKVSSTCPYCGVGCGVNVSVDAERSAATILGAEVHPANFGRLCSKGSTLADTVLAAEKVERLTKPQVAGDTVSWCSATTTIAEKIAQSIRMHGRESVAFYLSGQLLTEDYYAANKLMKGFIGSANIDTNSRLCMSSAVAAYKRAFGSDTVPCSYEDLELADLIVLIGSNAAWTHPVLYQRMVAAKENNPNLRVVLIDPRKTATDDLADLHLRLLPSSDGFLFQGLLNYLVNSDSLNPDYIDRHTDGFDIAKHDARDMSLARTAKSTGLDEKDLEAFFDWFAKTSKTVSFYSQGINQSTTGTDKCNAIINCHLATGKLGYAGAGPFSITGQPNAMGGREVGGLANQLAAHMDFEPRDVDRVQRFWQSPQIASEPGLKAVDLFAAVNSGQIKVLWIMATNPAVSLPDSNEVRKALEKCPTVIVSDVTHTDTTAFADILLPALAWGEKDGTVTNSERRISRQRKFATPPGESKADWWAVSQVAGKLGFAKEFAYKSSRDVFVEHASLSCFENNGERDFDIGGLAALSNDEYDALAPIQWPVNTNNPTGTLRMFEDGLFYTKNRRAQFVSLAPRLAAGLSDQRHRLLLNTGRLRDQWHTQTRTGAVPKLTAHDDVPLIEIHPADAREHRLEQNQFARLFNSWGEFFGRVEVSMKVLEGQLFSPIHWSDQFSKNSIVSRLISSEVDPVSGQPEYKAAAVSIEPLRYKRWARLVTNTAIDCSQFDYWVKSKIKDGYITLVSSNEKFDWQDWVNSNIAGEVKIIRFVDGVDGSERLIVTNNDQLAAMVFSHARVEKLPSYSWLESVFATTSACEAINLIGSEQGGADRHICSCFNVGEKAVSAAIQNGDNSKDKLARSLGCGSKCGSCLPELSTLLERQ